MSTPARKPPPPLSRATLRALLLVMLDAWPLAAAATRPFSELSGNACDCSSRSCHFCTAHGLMRGSDCSTSRIGPRNHSPPRLGPPGEAASAEAPRPNPPLPSHTLPPRIPAKLGIPPHEDAVPLSAPCSSCSRERR